MLDLLVPHTPSLVCISHDHCIFRYSTKTNYNKRFLLNVTERFLKLGTLSDHKLVTVSLFYSLLLQRSDPETWSKVQ